MLEGVVTRAVSGAYIVHVDGRVLTCTIRGVLRKDFRYTTSSGHARRVTRASTSTARDPVSVGDRVRVAPGPNETAVIEEVLPRQSHFTRAGFRGREQTIVSNIDLLVIVFACVEPRLDPWKLDRFLIAAESEDLPVLVLANKVDLGNDEDIRAFDEFRELGYEVVLTCAMVGTGIDTLRERLHNRIAAFVGPSGAGKSSILNALHPGYARRTAEIGGITYKGKHTTTAAELLAIPTGGWVADTPGLRRLELPPLPDRAALIACFPEFRDASTRCRFDNCRHHAEPNCAVRAMVEDQRASRRRYESYRALSADCDRPRW